MGGSGSRGGRDSRKGRVNISIGGMRMRRFIVLLGMMSSPVIPVQTTPIYSHSIVHNIEESRGYIYISDCNWTLT